MTIEQKRTVLATFCESRDSCNGCLLQGKVKCDCLAHTFTIPIDDIDKAIEIINKTGTPILIRTELTRDDVIEPSDKTIDDLMAESLSGAHIKDSGNRREFETGAVRDIQEGKGRCDLMPLDVVAELTSDKVIRNIAMFQQYGTHRFLELALSDFVLNYTAWCPDGYFSSQGVATMCLEVAKHFEDGAKKYGEYNWQKGIPTHCYVDSAVRHYMKHLRGDMDEPHDRAFCWNILCCIWTCMHKPELNDYVKSESVKMAELGKRIADDFVAAVEGEK